MGKLGAMGSLGLIGVVYLAPPFLPLLLSTNGLPICWLPGHVSPVSIQTLLLSSGRVTSVVARLDV